MYTVRKVNWAMARVYGLTLGWWVIVRDGQLASGAYRLKRYAQAEADFKNAHPDQLLIVVGRNTDKSDSP